MTPPTRKPFSQTRPRDPKPERVASPSPSPAVSVQAQGMAARDVAVSALFTVLVENRPFDDSFDKAAATRDLEPRDRAFARLIATSVLRHRGALKAVIGSYLEKPLPEHLGRLEHILLAAAAQLLLLKTPAHAAISQAVDQCRADKIGQRFGNLANAVLRRISESGEQRLSSLDNVALTVPPWLVARWTRTYGAETARAIGAASLTQAALDLTVKADGEDWARRLGGTLLPNGSVRLVDAGRIEALEGYEDGAWWVQDAAAALPVKLFGPVAGLSVLDLCAAPGGKSAQLAAAGAVVTAVDKSSGRLQRLRSNFERLKLDVEIARGDAATFAPGKTFDAVLLDAPCTSTGTIRRHPDIMTLKRPEDVAALAALQEKLLANAAQLVRPGGTLVYCTCSLEPEEGEDLISAFLKGNPNFHRKAGAAEEANIPSAWRTAAGDVRTLPSHLGEMPEGFKGLDGFYAAALSRAS